VDVVRTRHIGDFGARRMLALRDVDVAVDVGANVGQYGRLLRGAAYSGRIVSFEPLEDQFRELEQGCRADSMWTCRRVGLSDQAGVRTMVVSANPASSSLLEFVPETLADAPELRPVGAAEIEVVALDDIADERWSGRDQLLLKLDVQGSELDVLRGGRRTLAQAVAIEVELTILALYEGQPLISEVTAFLAEAGFGLVAIEPGYRDLRTGRLAQLDGLFVRF
jgi:FkbM family methyltransferase